MNQGVSSPADAILIYFLYRSELRCCRATCTPQMAWYQMIKTTVLLCGYKRLSQWFVRSILLSSPLLTSLGWTPSFSSLPFFSFLHFLLLSGTALRLQSPLTSTV
ncbi:hypothetical protein CPB83DRAFT_612268 [Crepidotus variabilis]|uniref:Uncharacterized protein n=1 Tax=Crepidotus variabilis TaxID=179855 RepID=A0A9P6JL67_9AGAR|nr:hypothetical protein CPB83DRAFT_612268 [Crepidotus variabilis]